MWGFGLFPKRVLCNLINYGKHNRDVMSSTSSDAMSEEFAGYEIYLAILAILLTVLVAAGLQPVVLPLMARVAGGHVVYLALLSLAVGGSS